MVGWLGKGKGKGQGSAQLLADYPPYTASHPGQPEQLSEEKARANYDHLMAEKPARLNALADLLRSQRIDLIAQLDADNPDLLFDVGLTLGECVVRRSTLHGWALDLEPSEKGEGMPSWRRAVVVREPHPTIPQPIVFDCEAIAIERYYRSQGPGMLVYGFIGRSVRDALQGVHARYWLAVRHQRP